MNKIRFVVTVIITLMSFSIAHAQPGAEIEVAKPKKYENRKLGAEKTGDKKFTIPRKFYQNTVTHYNYYFNANNRINEVIAAAKTAFKDDYSQLLPFYNYSLDVTSQSKADLDSVVYKCTAGILLHDLRNSWIDNMYLLLAKAYFLRKDLDSAQFTLQYINFSYAPKEEGGYDVPIGSNASNDKGEFSISTKEKNSIWRKLTSRPPSRNESFIWQIRTHIEKDELPEAAGIIEILKHDPNFPKRLQTDLHEVTAYWYYKQQAYDSAAAHLTQALNDAQNKQERARWEYLIAQMYQLTKKNEDAVNFYNRCLTHTTDPVMDVYARLNSIRIKRSDKSNYLQENIDALLKMAKRQKYQNYRDIIYYAVAKIELERNNTTNAQADLLKSVQFSTNNPLQRSQSFLLLADMNYSRQFFPESYNFYDSVEVNTLADTDKERVLFRKPPLQKIAENSLIVTKQDSLQALAKLPAAQRDAIIKKQVKLFLKSQGIKEEPGSTNTAVQKVPDLFSDNNKSNDFYFYNSGLKARGFSEFKARWGERKNVDNWRRKSAINRQSENLSDVTDTAAVVSGNTTQKASDNSYEGMLQNIPLTEEKMNASNKSIMDALFTIAQTFVSPLEEYPAAIKTYEELLRRFPNTPNKQEAWFNLVYAYQKTGNKAKSDEYKNLLLHDASESKWAGLIKNPRPAKNDIQHSPATKKYEEIYNLFIEGKFEQAKKEKKTADSIYGKTYWTPQLLYIEAVYYIKQQQDPTAIRILTDLANLNSDSTMTAKANTMIDVLKRRKEIEAYLTKLNVSRNTGNNAPALDQKSTTPARPERKVDTTSRAMPPVVKKADAVTAKKDSAIAQQSNVAAPVTDSALAKQNEAVSPGQDTALAQQNDTTTPGQDTALAEQNNAGSMQNDAVTPDQDTAQNNAGSMQNDAVTPDQDTALAQQNDTASAVQDTASAEQNNAGSTQNDAVTPDQDTALAQQNDTVTPGQDTASAEQNSTGSMQNDAVTPAQDSALAKQNNAGSTRNDAVTPGKDTAVAKQNDIATSKQDTAVAKQNNAVSPKQEPPLAKQNDVVPPKRDTAAAKHNDAITPKRDTALAKENHAVAPKKDTVPAKPAPSIVVKDFSFVASDSQYVAVVLDKVDKVYASEANNAFNRYNRENYYNQRIEVSSIQLDERFNMVLQGPFANSAAAMDYINKVRPVTKSSIVPWLTPDKYSFILISNANLQVLKSGKDMDAYRQLLQKAFPNKF